MGIQTKGTRKVHVNTASKEEKGDFKKRQNRYFWTDDNNNNKMK